MSITVYADFQSNLRFLPTLAVSPRGDRIAYVDDTTGQFNLVVQSLTDGARQTLTSYVDTAVRHVAWADKGETIIYFADRQGDEQAQIYRIPADGSDGPEEFITTSGVQFVPSAGPSISPDGRLFVYAANDRVPSDQDVHVVDLVTREARRIYAGGGQAVAGFWSPDGRRLTVAEKRVVNADHAVYVVSLDGQTPPLGLTRSDIPHTNWLGPWLPDGSGFLVMTNYKREFNGLAVMDPVTGELDWWDTPDWDIEEVVLSEDGRVAVWTVRVDNSVELRMRDLSTGRTTTVPGIPMGGVSGLAMTPDGKQVVLRLSTPTRPWNIAATDLATGQLRWLTQAEPARVDRATFVEPRLVRYPSRDGQHIPGFLYQPKPDGKLAGMVISIHGGPAWYETPTYLYDGFYQYLLSLGIGVFGPNMRGSVGYGRTYQDVLNRDWGGIDLRDFEDAVAYLRTLDWVDPERIAIFGSSYGGFAALSCLSRLPDLNWAAGVDFYGPSNLITLAKAAPPTWRKLIEATFGDPDRDAEHLLQRSPVTYADRIVAPLLVLQGANDPRVPKTESDQIVQRLRARGVHAEYEVFPDEGHGFTKRRNQERAFSLAGDFLARHLNGAIEKA